MEISVPEDATVLEWIDPSAIKFPEKEVRNSLLNPIGMESLPNLVKPGDRVTISFDDPLTPRKVAQTVIPVVIEMLAEIGIRHNDINLISANSAHCKRTREEFSNHLGSSIINNFAFEHDKDPRGGGLVRNHDCVDPEKLKMLGFSSLGDWVEINRLAVESDLLIHVGNVRAVPWGGYSGTSVTNALGSIKCISATYSYSVFANIGSCHADPQTSVYRNHKQAINDQIEQATERKIFYIDCLSDSRGSLTGIFSGHSPEINGFSWKRADEYCIQNSPEADILIIGIPKAIAYDTSDNPLMAMYAIALAPRMWLNRPLLKEGGIVIGIVDSNGKINEKKLPSYPEIIKMFDSCHASEAMQEYEERFWYREDYLFKYSHCNAYHANHGIWTFYLSDYLFKRAGRIIMAGVKNPGVFRGLGFSVAKDFKEAWSLVRNIYRNPTVVVLPTFLSKPMFKFNIT